MLKSSVQTENYIEMLFAALTEYKDLTGTVEEGLDGQQLFSNVYNKFNLEYTNRKKAELLSWEEDRIYQRTREVLERFQQVLRMESIQASDQAFARIKGLFEQEQETFEKDQREALQVVEYVFDFLEGAFGNSQEMVMFLTELNSNSYSVSFLQECECERYFQYNKELLFDEKRRNLLRRM